MNKIVSTVCAVISIVLLSACTNAGPKNYEEIRKYSVKCVEKVINKLASNDDPEGLMSPHVLMLDDGVINLSTDIQNKFNGLNPSDIAISQTIDTVMQGSKFCYSLVNVTLPDSQSFQVLVMFDGKGDTGTEGKPYVRATRGLIDVAPSEDIEGGKYQVNFTHSSDLSDYYEQYCARYAEKTIKPFIEQFNAKRKQTLYPNLNDFKGYLTTDTIKLP